jgi:hypothetical protein
MQVDNGIKEQFLRFNSKNGQAKTPQSLVQLSALNYCTKRTLTELDNTKGCNNTIKPPEDEHGGARNM